mmetsp:Transcript_9796/g.28969  ORF Transcript_9796/g.28969 Transcript_9796/m.28969 type:complete len:217 (+) Transcript_9796:1046-1696(+)
MSARRSGASAREKASLPTAASRPASSDQPFSAQIASMALRAKRFGWRVRRMRSKTHSMRWQISAEGSLRTKRKRRTMEPRSLMKSSDTRDDSVIAACFRSSSLGSRRRSVMDGTKRSTSEAYCLQRSPRTTSTLLRTAKGCSTPRCRIRSSMDCLASASRRSKSLPKAATPCARTAGGSSTCCPPRSSLLMAMDCRSCTKPLETGRSSKSTSSPSV